MIIELNDRFLGEDAAWMRPDGQNRTEVRVWYG